MEGIPVLCEQQQSPPCKCHEHIDHDAVGKESKAKVGHDWILDAGCWILDAGYLVMWF
jgi:hypothetical protein